MYMPSAVSKGQGLDELCFFPFYSGIVVHNCLNAYFKDVYRFDHVLCNAHLLRECFGIVQWEWAEQMVALLQKVWELASDACLKDLPLSEEAIQAIKNRYDAILDAGKAEWEQGFVRVKIGTKGRKIKSKATNLGERFATL